MHTAKPIAALLVLVTLCATASAKVVIKKAPIDVQYKTFDPANPPPEMPHLDRATEEAITTSSFRIQAALDSEVADRKRTADGWTTTVDVRGLTLTLQLHVIVYTPQGVGAKLKAHEEGHRKIAEQIYQERAIPAAKEMGALMDGKRFIGVGPDYKTAGNNALNPPLEDMAKRYLELTANVATEVNNTYDDLTVHGTNDKPEAQAIKEAFGRYVDNHPTTRPAKPAAPPG